MVQTKKKVALLHRYPAHRIKETNAAFPYLEKQNIDVLTFSTFDRMSNRKKIIKSFIWIFYSAMLVFRKNYDIIYCDDSFPFYPALVKLASPKSKVVIRIGDFHLMYYFSGVVYKFFHMFERWGWRQADKIIVISEVMQDYFTDRGIASHVVVDPVEPADFIPDPRIKGEDNIVMFHGLLTKNKHIDLVIHAASRLPDIYFWIVGDGPDRDRLERSAGRNVIFTGWHTYSQIGALIQNCTIGLALRSDNPGNQYVVTSPFLQYAASGKPCLVTKRKVFKNYEWQFETVDEMVDKIKVLLKNRGEGYKLRNRVLKKHNARKVAEKIWSLLLS